MDGLGDEARFYEHLALDLGLSAHERLHATLMLSHLEPEYREGWVLQACAEFPDGREPWCEVSQLQADAGDGARRCRRRGARSASPRSQTTI